VLQLLGEVSRSRFARATPRQIQLMCILCRFVAKDSVFYLAA